MAWPGPPGSCLSYTTLAGNEDPLPAEALPILLLVQLLEGHKCVCTICDPLIMEKLKEQAKALLKEEYIAELGK